jgi:hypothetical protein
MIYLELLAYLMAGIITSAVICINDPDLQKVDDALIGVWAALLTVLWPLVWAMSILVWGFKYVVQPGFAWVGARIRRRLPSPEVAAARSHWRGP